MIASIKSILAHWSNRNDASKLRKALEATQDDLTALRTSIVAITAKLDADATVTDTDYAATCNPAALTLTQ